MVKKREGRKVRVRRRGVTLPTRRIACAVVALLPLLIGVSAEMASAYALFGCRWPNGAETDSISVRVASLAGYTTPASNARSSWNSAQSKISLTTSSSANAQVQVAYPNRGNTGLDGLTTCSYGCIGANFAGQVFVEANGYYTDGYDSNGRQQVLAHELGHAIGLAHAGTNALMYSSSDRWFVYGIKTPQTDDVNGVAAAYP